MSMKKYNKKDNYSYPAKPKKVKSPKAKFKIGDKVKITKKVEVNLGGKLTKLTNRTGIITDVRTYDIIWYYVKVEQRVWALMESQIAMSDTGSSWASEKI